MDEPNRMINIPGDSHGVDALSRAFCGERFSTTACRIWSLPWFLMSLVLVSLAAFAGGSLLDNSVLHLTGFLAQWNELEAPHWLERASYPVIWMHDHTHHAIGLIVAVVGASLLLSLIGCINLRGVFACGIPALKKMFGCDRWIPCGQESIMAGGIVLLAALTWIDPKIAFSVFTAVLCLWFLATVAFRFICLIDRNPNRYHIVPIIAWSIGLGLFAWHAVMENYRLGIISLFVCGLSGHVLRTLCALIIWRRKPPVSLDDPEVWPLYTILVPLYKETRVAASIVRQIQGLDYPKDRLDVLFLLEHDDALTREALVNAGVLDWSRILVMPAQQPRTKPRACNYGLEHARGEFLVIFDAEDRPEPDQLKKAVRSFATQPKDVICLQAQLAYYNHNQNLLTRWFAIEYNVWFAHWLPGLDARGGPLPLGGTSNHFRTAALRTLGGWDPFNVTEDCDLGVRLHLAGFHTAMLDSVTWEEANSRVWNWIRQRSRWMKGYLITHMVWARNPWKLLWKLGPVGALRYFHSIFGIPALALLSLPMWLLMAVYAGALIHDMQSGATLLELLWQKTPAIHPGRWSWPLIGYGEGLDAFWSILSVIFCSISGLLFLGNGFFILINVLFGRRAGQQGLWIAALLSPIYWVLISIGAWKGLIQLLTSPHYWEKTIHGLDQKH